MKTITDLQQALRHIDNRGYPAYKALRGAYDFSGFTLLIDHVQGDPFAAPSRLRIRVPQSTACFPEDTFHNRSRQIALEDYLTRAFHAAQQRLGRRNRGSGKSGEIQIDRPGQQILERSAVMVDDEAVEVRFTAGLPAFGRKVAGRHATTMLCEEIPLLVKEALLFSALNQERLDTHLKTAEDSDVLRDQLEENNLIAFIADGAILPRASGVDSRPLSSGTVVPFSSPDLMRVTLTAPNAGPLSGMGIRKGITLIVGGGYHGKSTLLKALELGIYNHIPGDGREQVVTNPNAVKIRAEDGRRIEKVAITPFISDLPFGQNTDAFCSEDASGSTSQAANIIEALELGAQALLIDEDTSATNFMIRDHRMQELVAKDREPITPFIDKVQQLKIDQNVSTLLVIGGSGDYFDVADHVICMHDYAPEDVTEQATAIAQRYRAERTPEGGAHFGALRPRIPLPQSFDARKGKRDVKITARGLHTLQFGKHDIDLSAVEQLIDPSQTRAIGQALLYASQHLQAGQPLASLLTQLIETIESEGLDALSPHPVGHHAAFRRFELAAAINRLRTLRIEQQIHS